MYYVLTDPTTGAIIAVFMVSPYSYNIPNVSIHVFSGDVPDLSIKQWDTNTDTFVDKTNIVLTRLMFMNRFTPQERIGIRSSTDPVVSDIIHMLDIAQDVTLTDPTTIQSVNYLVSVGLLTSARATTILTP